MRPLPAGEGVGGESGMHHGKRRLIIQVRQIQVKAPQLRRRQHALVDNGSG
ncbi:hypothetical protein SDC9_124576 [bioreactor metagenome]|uniref:Uncharacterized protein n=1 Tax=bioreactor metagenome TaxID=1076179 RepID=A0A645CKR1_9ZZZZ